MEKYKPDMRWSKFLHRATCACGWTFSSEKYFGPGLKDNTSHRKRCLVFILKGYKIARWEDPTGKAYHVEEWS